MPPFSASPPPEVSVLRSILDTIDSCELRYITSLSKPRFISIWSLPIHIAALVALGYYDILKGIYYDNLYQPV